MVRFCGRLGAYPITAIITITACPPRISSLSFYYTSFTTYFCFTMEPRPRQTARLRLMLKKHKFDTSLGWEQASEMLWGKEPQYMLTSAVFAEKLYQTIRLRATHALRRDAWVLEVVEFLTERKGNNGWETIGGKYRHVGYMRAKFKTKKDACSYYDRHNPQMRPLNAHGTNKSDWDPATHLFYIVRKDYGCVCTVAPFSKTDEPETSGTVTTYSWLK